MKDEHFTIYPAIDLRHGLVVRLEIGDPERQTVFGDDPTAAGRRWLAAGATWLHVVNLDGAFGEKSAANWEALKGLARLSGLIQFGGGIRTLADVDRALHAGATRVIIGTAAVENPDLVVEAMARHGSDAIVVGIDALEGRVRTRGWQGAADLTPLGLAEQMASVGVRRIIHTDISRDGVLAGVNTAASATLRRATGLAVIASGGVASTADIVACHRAGLNGVIVGRALYDGNLNLEDAIAAVENGLRKQ